LLNERNIEFQYREYKKNPLSEDELQALFRKLKIPANTLLRKREKAYKELSLTGKESNDELLPHFVAHPGLMQRPILICNDDAIVGRPVEKLLDLLPK